MNLSSSGEELPSADLVNSAALPRPWILFYFFIFNVAARPNAADLLLGTAH